MRVIPTRFAGALAAFFAMVSTPLVAQDKDAGWSLAIHGGAGTIARENMTPEQDAAYRAALQRALDAGAAVLRDGGSAMEAIQAAIEPMEDDPLFNAGRGAVLTWDGDIELDASIMDGRTRDAGAVAGVTGIRHPIELARLVMTDSPHVMLAGKGAETFAEERGLERMPREWFETERRKEALERMKAERLSALDVDIKFGTVGAVARDSKGNLAAGTSTGGMTGKRWGRVGDAPVIGAGTYADNRACAVSATGWGEFFIRVGVAQEICTRIRLVRQQAAFASGGAQHAEWLARQDYVQRITDAVLAEVEELGGDGGVIVVTPLEDPVFGLNTSGMYRGRATSGGVNEVAIYADE
ncbi:isoaspartyl peptidase/L-asparaginase family protein [Qipengyuania flava]|uniref:isoaspartyl peptidase/L-asparaginase family protein n=1 Tax=Qipengyuania flava TaxID=192812 RepID=UPI001C56E948|nr:isoaspartyl peptidase/L-asparaginase [Qipengyuania flava]MBW3167281.1 isoaspartyl peptidase/L-asparaginase [Qipengyuania flava]MBY5964519.1 isoaspartyl peptidase/L-asparaginase [Qipengyuania flava]MBY6010843.1 isoaspartyl peptidase/L-asparaginase [Qipengyuania flava]MBY6025285.1 isoaspartyl peptidase/L-asparaginase [Qipengyuania flava]